MAKKKQEDDEEVLTTLSLKDTIKMIKKEHGEHSITFGKDLKAVRRMPIPEVPAFNFVTNGGFLIHRTNEIIGPASSGKSFLTYKAIRYFQNYDWETDTFDAYSKLTYAKGRDGFYDVDVVTPRLPHKAKIKKPSPMRCVLIDYENTYDKDWGKRLGVNNDGLIHIVPNKGSAAVDQIDAMLRSEEVCLVVVDSIGAIGSDAEIEASMENEQMGSAARFFNKAIRKFRAAMNSNPNRCVTLILINRGYEKVGFVLGNPNVVYGGVGMKLEKSLAIELQNKGDVKVKDASGKEVVSGRNIGIKCTKDKAGQPMRDAVFYFSFTDDGELKPGETNVTAQLVEIGLKLDIIKKKAAFYSYGTFSKQGREAFEEELDSSGLLAKLQKEVYAKISNNG